LDIAHATRHATGETGWIMRRNVQFPANDVTLAGWLYEPDRGNGPFPLIVLAHGLAALKEMGLDAYAQVFVAAGFACLAYDHRNFGESGGTPRLEIDPWQQMHDYRHAISFARTLPRIDPRRIGVWGSSYSGGHALVVAAVDRRVRCVVAQVPLISGYLSTLRAMPAEQMGAFLQRCHAERERRARGEPPEYVPVAESGEFHDWLVQAAQGTTWKNEVTLLSREMFLEYEPGAFIHRISPTPLLMIVGDHDVRGLTDVQLAAFQQAAEPKRLVLLDAGHYDPYTTRFPEASTAARDWFREHL
jgi:fermentation-respiration switch protein FrsA (DUF1100 family)